MNLPPLPSNPDPLSNWSLDEQVAILAWGELCIKMSRKGPPKKFSQAEISTIREYQLDGWGYKEINKLYPMHLETYYDIVKHRGAYK